MRYISGKAKRGTSCYCYVKDTETGTFEPNCTKYLKHKARQNRSVNTVIRISRGLSYYMNFLNEKELTVKEVATMHFSSQTDHFSDFLTYVKDGRHTGTLKPVKNNTANSYLQSVFGLYDFLHRETGLPFLKVLDDRMVSYVDAIGVRRTASRCCFDGYLRENDHVSRMATADDIRKILSSCTCLRDKILIRVMEETGLRIGEALGIKYTEDLDIKSKKIHVRYRPDNENLAFAKYAEERSVLISDTTAAMIEIYLSENIECFEKTDYLFIVLKGRNAGKPLSANTFYSALSTIGKRCGLHITNHSLRHYFADERRRADWSLVEISKALGHRNLATTEKYLHVAGEEIEAAQKKYLKAKESAVDVSDFL